MPLTFILSRRGREKKNEKILTMPLTLPSPTAGRGEKDNGKRLTAPLTFILSRKGREDKIMGIGL
jgi:hypothetical protein